MPFVISLAAGCGPVVVSGPEEQRPTDDIINPASGCTVDDQSGCFALRLDAGLVAGTSTYDGKTFEPLLPYLNSGAAHNGQDALNAYNAGTRFADGIANTTFDPLYMSEVWVGEAAAPLIPATFTFALPDGEYTVHLHFADWHLTSTNSPGDRVFDVFLNDERVLDDFDIIAAVGREAAALESFDVVVSGGALSMTLAGVVFNPTIQAVEILTRDAVALLVAPEDASAASCTDGLRNQEEAGVDCGGPCPDCVSGATCDDGLSNQGEAGVDCGGPCAACASGVVYYVSQSGNDATGNGSAAAPWRTLAYAAARVPAGLGHTIKLSAGTFVENAYVNIPPGVNVEGAGIGQTILKPAPSIYFQSGSWVFDRYLLMLRSSAMTNGDQTLKDFTLDGDGKRIYGGIIVQSRRNVVIENVRVQYTYFTGIWLWSTEDCRVTEVQAKDCAWGSPGGASAAILVSDSVRTEIDNNEVDEGTGQAFEAVSGKMWDLKVHDNRFSVTPIGNWQTPEGVTTPNIAVEFYDTGLVGCEFYNNYVDNNFSIVQGTSFATPTGVQALRVHHNVFDIRTRAAGYGSAIELTAHDVEIDHNWIWGGGAPIANWDASPNAFTRHNWKIHHNVFYDVQSYWPTAIIAMFKKGVVNAHIYNNTVETVGGSTVHFLEVNNSGVAKNVRIENNLIIDNSAPASWGPGKLISLQNGATMQDGVVRHNFLDGMAIGSVAGVTYSGNLTGDPQLQTSGARPDPYYTPAAASPLIDAGVLTGSLYEGAAPDVGAYER